MWYRGGMGRPGNEGKAAMFKAVCVECEADGAVGRGGGGAPKGGGGPLKAMGGGGLPPVAATCWLTHGPDSNRGGGGTDMLTGQEVDRAGPW